MAYSKASTQKSVWGNKRVETFVLTSDAASGAVATSVGVIECVMTAPKSANTAGPKFKANLSAAGAASNGSLMVSSMTSGDDFYVTVIGRG